jgi:hypothetical protein
MSLTGAKWFAAGVGDRPRERPKVPAGAHSAPGDMTVL